MRNVLSSCVFLLAIAVSSAQAPIRYTTADIYHKIEKLDILGSVLYVAAHPDDENTFVISYLANEAKARTAYLSLTRGDGGQNLIGPEMREMLGVIRTQELLAARRLDGGEQLFSRANDFGYSKTSEETLEIWDEKAVLGDVVWAIRTFKPDVVINRFHHDSSGKTHGHHSASAELSYEAYDLAGDPTAYPEQLQYVDVHQPQRLFFNTSYWFYGRDRAAFDAADKSKMVKLDVGVYYPHKGMSNNELAAYSRSQHVCQGMGRTPQRGTDIEYLELLKGDMPPDDGDLLSGITTNWSRVPGGADISSDIATILAAYDHNDPAASIPALATLYGAIKALPAHHWKVIKLQEVEEIILAAGGIFVEAIAARNKVTPGSTLAISAEVINRSNASVTLQSIQLTGGVDTLVGLALSGNVKATMEVSTVVPLETPITDPYWLRSAGSLGMYQVGDYRLVGLPETPRSIKASFTLDVEGQDIVIDRDVIHKSTDRERGEEYRPLEVTLPLSVRVNEPVYIFADSRPRSITVNIKTVSPNLAGTLLLPVPEGWEVRPTAHDWSIAKAGGEETFTFTVIPPTKAAAIDVQPIVQVAETTYDKELVVISYEHIPDQLVVQSATARLVKLDIQTNGQNIAYINGAGDEVPASLRQIGYDVTELTVQEISAAELARYDAVILGIRAYNKHEDLKFKQSLLFDYAKAGGTLVTQYTATWGLKVGDLMPLDLTLGRDRVTVEEAEVRILAPDHPMMRSPNMITTADFDGWVQERGLYFAKEWDQNFVPLLSSNDPGEPARDGGMLVAEYGKGYLVYTGYSWFRQLPAGVAGAYRLFANMISQTPVSTQP